MGNQLQRLIDAGSRVFAIVDQFDDNNTDVLELKTNINDDLMTTNNLKVYAMRYCSMTDNNNYSGL